MDGHHEQSREKRRAPRFPFKAAVKFQIGEYTCPDGSLSRDLSKGGICLTVNEFIPVKKQVVVYLQGANQSRLIELKGVVAWVKEIPESERYLIGVQFCDIDESARKEVNRILVAINNNAV
jgi:c-di-GMP-binding flagellar brake protein YcgR